MCAKGLLFSISETVAIPSAGMHDSRTPKTGKWKKFSTKENNLEKAKLVAQRQFYVRSELISNNIDIDSKRFSYVVDYVVRQLQADIDEGTGKKNFEDYIRVIKRFKEFFGAKYIENITY